MKFVNTKGYLKNGNQTIITSQIAKIASLFKGDSLEKIKGIMSFVESLNYSGFDENLFRKRTADQIAADGFVTGCTDSCLIFVTLSRACGIPAKYVETVDENWLKLGSSTSIHGHQYAQVWSKEEKRWIWIDPLGGRIDIQGPEAENRIIYKVGLDSWDIGITSFEALEKLFTDFQKKFR